MLNQKKMTTRQLTDYVISLLKGFDMRIHSGDITPERARREACDQIRHLRYGKGGRNYFWINDMNPIMIMHPHRIDLEGKDLTGFKDSDGLHVFINIVKKIMDDDEGFINYRWQMSPGDDDSLQKLSYVKRFPPWKWIIGTGTSVDDLHREVNATTERFVKIFLIFLFLILIFSAYITGQIFQIEQKKQMAEESKRLETLRLKKLFELSHLSERSLDTIVEFAVEETVNMTNSRLGYLAFMNSEETELTMKIWSSQAVKDCRVHDKRLVFPLKTSGIWAETARTGKAVIVNDYENLNSKMKRGLPEGHVPVSRLLSIPVFDGRRIVAVAGVGNKRSDYDDQDVQQMQQMMEGMWQVLKKKKIEDELRESEQMYRLLFDGAGIVISIYDNDGRCLLMNRRLANLFGGEPEEFTGRSVKELHPVIGEKYYYRIREVIETEEIREYDDVVDFPDGSKKNFQSNVLPVKNSDGKPYAVKIISQDITKRRKLKEKLQQARKMESIGTLAGGIAHDFNNILSSIMGFAELARLRAKDDEDLKNDLNQVLAAGVRARDLVRHILTFSRKTDTQKALIPVTPLVKESIKFLRASTPPNLEIKTRLKDGTVLADPTKLHQVFMNLFTNAAYAMRENGGTLEVTLETVDTDSDETDIPKTLKPGRYLDFRVSDTGPGIAPHLKDKIFEPFFTTKARGEGTGMGLSTVYGIIKEMHGHISVSSEPGSGTVFRVLFPETRQDEISTLDLQEDTALNNEVNILLVDDEPSIIEFIRGMLKNLGYSVEAFTDSARALEKFKSDPDAYDLVLTDMKIPGMSGFELSSLIISEKPGIPVILFTGFSEGLTVEKVKEYGISQILTKPVIMSELSKKIKLALKQ